jgi:hypothetical protein
MTPKKKYTVIYKNTAYYIDADYCMEHYANNRLSFFTGKEEYFDMSMNPLVASFPLNKSAIINVVNN